MHSSVTETNKHGKIFSDRLTVKYTDTQLNNINRGYTIIEYKFVMRKFFQCDVLQDPKSKNTHPTPSARSAPRSPRSNLAFPQLFFRNQPLSVCVCVCMWKDNWTNDVTATVTVLSTCTGVDRSKETRRNCTVGDKVESEVSLWVCIV